jgi:activator of 2-hydroxyglutaryl-CoA dehydratase
MRRIIVDSGTAYSKVYYLDKKVYEIIPTREFKKKLNDYKILAATGHNSNIFNGIYINELIALAEGGMRLIKDNEFTLLDCGARDIKYVKVKNSKVISMDWNSECGAFAGQLIDLLRNYFNVDTDKIIETERSISVICGVLGMTLLFDKISQGISYEEAFMEFIKGIAHNCENILKNPDKIYLSGGLCENKAFLRAFKAKVIPIGRFVLIEGLKGYIEESLTRPSSSLFSI